MLTILNVEPHKWLHLMLASVSYWIVLWDPTIDTWQKIRNHQHKKNRFFIFKIFLTGFQSSISWFSYIFTQQCCALDNSATVPPKERKFGSNESLIIEHELLQKKGRSHRKGSFFKRPVAQKWSHGTWLKVSLTPLIFPSHPTTL